MIPTQALSHGCGWHLRFYVLTYVPLPAVVVVIFFLLPGSSYPAPTSDRVANYSIDVRLHPQSHSLDGTGVLTWHNASGHKTDELLFHLYQNAFRSSNSTCMIERGNEISASASGWIDVERLTDLRTNEDLTSRARFVQPDDGNLHDSTVMMVQLSNPILPGDSIEVSFQFREKLPEAASMGGSAPGSGFYLVTRWFPKIGVFESGGWNCHQVHATAGSFADFGRYDVRINVPSGYMVGATGVEIGSEPGAGETTIYRFVADDVNDFAWTASHKLFRVERTFRSPGLPNTKVILLLQPEDRMQADRYFTAVDTALEYYGSWYGPYPYPVLTVVDPPRAFGISGMNAHDWDMFGLSYPGLVAASPFHFEFGGDHPLETEIADEFGRQYWHWMAAGDDIEEAWLDAGLNAYTTERFLEKFYGPCISEFRISDVYSVRLLPLIIYKGLPVAAIPGKISIREPYLNLPLYLRHEKSDAVSEYGYRAIDRAAYRTVSRSKPELILQTLQGVLGKDVMAKAVRTYFEEFKFNHPTASDFESVCERVSGKNLAWFFSQFVDGTGTVDFAVKSVEFYRETDLNSGTSLYITNVVVVRNGGIRMPVDLRLVLDDGTASDTVWEGENRWQSFSFRSASPPDYAVLDPSGRIPLDTKVSNNSMMVHPSFLPVVIWAAKILEYFQNVLIGMGALI